MENYGQIRQLPEDAQGSVKWAAVESWRIGVISRLCRSLA